MSRCLINYVTPKYKYSQSKHCVQLLQIFRYVVPPFAAGSIGFVTQPDDKLPNAWALARAILVLPDYSARRQLGNAY